MLKLLPHIKPNYKTEIDNSLLEETASDFRRIADAAELGKIEQGLCRDGEYKISKSCEGILYRKKIVCYIFPPFQLFSKFAQVHIRAEMSCKRRVQKK